MMEDRTTLEVFLRKNIHVHVRNRYHVVKGCDSQYLRSYRMIEMLLQELKCDPYRKFAVTYKSVCM